VHDSKPSHAPPAIFIHCMPLVPPPSLFPGLWTGSEYTGIHTLRLVRGITIPFGLLWCSVAMDSAEASFTGGPVRLPAGVGRKEGKGVYPGVDDVWLLLLYWQCVLRSVCEGRRD